MNALDLILLLVLFVAMPLYGVRSMRKLRVRLAAGHEAPRVREYSTTIAVQWTLVAATLALWAWTGRPFAALGLTFATGAWSWLGIGLGLLACAVLVAQMVAIVRSPEKTAAARAECEPMGALLPQDDRESRAFAALSVTAGVCEEILYRGFAIAALAPLTGTLAAALLTSVAFGLGHSYQGAGGAAKTGAIGLVMVVLYLLSGSLWVPMVVHAVMDLTSGRIARHSLATVDAPLPAGTG
jgi:CAAX protease family protein